jgi:hypothetical protein
MSAGVRMFAGVPVRRAVAAECHAARLACSQVNPEAADLHALFAFPTLRLLDGFNRIQVSTAPVGHDALFACPLFADALRRDVDAGDGHAAFADGRSATLNRSGAHVACCKDSR